jgi:hypothetical protein
VIVTGVARDRFRLDWALKVGADHVIDVDADDPVARVKELNDGRGADVVIDAAAGNPITVNLAWTSSARRPRGRRGHEGPPLEGFHSDWIPTRRITLHPGAGLDTEGAVALINAGKVPTADLLGETFPLDRFEDAFALLTRSTPGTMPCAWPSHSHDERRPPSRSRHRHRAGRVLVECRGCGLAGDELKAAGDARSSAASPPPCGPSTRTTPCSPKRRPTTPPGSPRGASGSSTPLDGTGSSARSTAPTGPSTSPWWRMASSWRARSRCPRKESRCRTAETPPTPTPTPTRRPAGREPDPAHRARDRARGRARRRARADGERGREGRGRGPGEADVYAHTGGQYEWDFRRARFAVAERGRPAHLALRRITPPLQPGEPVDARPLGVPADLASKVLAAIQELAP